VAALGLSLPSQFLDVNVHPRKAEVTFVHERAVFATVQEAVETVLQRCMTGGLSWAGEENREWSSPWVAAPEIGDAEAPYGGERPPGPVDQWQPLGQVGHTFIVASGPEGLLLLDQHAADECLLYARLMAADEPSMELSAPMLLTLTASQQRWLDILQPALAAFRIQIEPFGRETVLVRAVPAMLVDRLRPGNFLDAWHEAMQRISPGVTPEEVREHLGAALACRTALRAGDGLTADQVAVLVQAVAQQRLSYTCPHGRPTYVTLSLSDLERRFLRLFPLDTSSSGC
jgi:DNA mismatch repair protein MutL